MEHNKGSANLSKDEVAKRDGEKLANFNTLMKRPSTRKGSRLRPGDLQVVQRDIVAVAADQEFVVQAINVKRSEMFEVLVPAPRAPSMRAALGTRNLLVDSGRPVVLHEVYVIELNVPAVTP
eukprot:763864-Hanusia_phi.AAC.4